MQNWGDNFKPYQLGEITCHSQKKLIHSIGANWDIGVEHFKNGYISQWVETELRDSELKNAFDAFAENADGDFDVALCLALAALDSRAPTYYKGILLTHDGLIDFIMSEDDENKMGAYISEIFEHELLSRTENEESEKLKNLEETWYREVLAFFFTRAQMLTYKDFWDDHKNISLKFIDSTTVDAGLVELQDNHQDFRKIIKIWPHYIKANILLYILNSQNSLKESMIKAGVSHDIEKLSCVAPDTVEFNGKNFANRTCEEYEKDKKLAIKRSWISDFLSNQNECLGANLVIQHLVANASNFVNDLEERKAKYYSKTKDFCESIFSMKLMMRHLALGLVSFLLVLSGLVFENDLAFIGAALPVFIAFFPHVGMGNAILKSILKIILIAIISIFSGIAFIMMLDAYIALDRNGFDKFFILAILFGCASVTSSLLNRKVKKKRQLIQLKKFDAKIAGSKQKIPMHDAADIIRNL